MKKYLVYTLGFSLYSQSNICVFDDELSAKIYCEQQNSKNNQPGLLGSLRYSYYYQPIPYKESYDYTSKESQKILQKFISEKEQSIKEYQDDSNKNKESIENNALKIKEVENEITGLKDLLKSKSN